MRGRQVAAELRRLRDVAALTGEEAAHSLGWSASKISRIETGPTPPSAADLRKLLDLYQVTGTQRDRLELLRQSAGQRGWWDAYADVLGPEYAALIALEADAESIRWYSPMLIPGLLQTEGYAREVVRSGLLIAPPGEVERRVQVKMTRQRVLTREPAASQKAGNGPGNGGGGNGSGNGGNGGNGSNGGGGQAGREPLRLSVVLDEAALLRPVGGAGVMRQQLSSLVEMTARPNVVLHVLPLVTGVHPATTGEFTILSFPELIAPDVVYLEHMTSDLYVEREADVYRYALAFDQLRAQALDPPASVAMIKAVMDRMN